MSRIPPSTARLLSAVELEEPWALECVLLACDGRDVRSAATSLGCSYSALYRLLARRPDLRGAEPADQRLVGGAGPRKRCEARKILLM